MKPDRSQALIDGSRSSIDSGCSIDPFCSSINRSRDDDRDHFDARIARILLQRSRACGILQSSPLSGIHADLEFTRTVHGVRRFGPRVHMTGAPAILLVDSRGSDRTLTTLLLQHQLPHAVITEARDAVTLSDALAAHAPHIALVAADVAWASPSELVETIRRCRPQAAVILFGHQADIAKRVLNPGLACDGIVRKSSAGFLALGSIISSALERTGVHGSRVGSEPVPSPTSSIADERDPDEDRREIALLFSHDLREPVQQLVRLARQGQTEDPQSTRRVLSHVLERAERLSTMLDGMTEYLIVGGSAVTPAVIDLNACLEKAFDNLRSSIAETHVEIRVAGDRLTSVGDEQQMVHLFQNLVSNAIKFRNGDHPVISISAERCGDRWLMRFQDNGIGIPEASTERIFDLGARLHSAQEYPGAGIGLALCRRIVERHNGRIWVESRPGDGSTFLLLLPCAQPSERPSTGHSPRNV
jgi:signal transduction histidine kinase